MTRTAYGRPVADTVTVAEIAAMIDHALLKPEMTPDEVLQGCSEAAKLGVWSVCVKPADVGLAIKAVAGTSTKVCAVVSFPHGNSASHVKIVETQQAVADGAREIDLVLNIARLRAGESDYVGDEIRGVVEAAHAANCLVKVILETAYLTDDQIANGSQLAEQAGADFVKTSTGFAASGATVAAMRVMAESASPAVRLKASGGIRSLDRALEFVALGVTRLGVSASEGILAEAAVRVAKHGVIEVPDEVATNPSSPDPDGY